MKKLLLYRRGGLGDTLLTFPLLEIFKRKGFHVTAVGNTDYFSLAKYAGWADRVLPEIPDEEFDKRIIISIDGDIYPFPKSREWIVQYYLRKLKLEESFSYVLPLKDTEGELKGKVILHPSSGSFKKNPDIELFLRIEEYLKNKGLEVVYFVGEADEWIKEYVNNYYEDFNIINIAKNFKGALFYIGLDSGISHLSAYLGLPTVIIYGPTDPVIWKPIGKHIFQVSLNLECSPCFPNVCETKECLNTERLFKKLLPLLDHLLVNINKNYFL